MHVRVRDPAYADRLAAFLSSVGQTAVVTAPDQVGLGASDEDGVRAELSIYLSVWTVLYPDAEAELVSASSEA
jgi:hypothetical protein